MPSSAVISAIGDDRPGIVGELSTLVRSLGLNIDDSRMTVLGGEFAVLMLVTGAEAPIARLEDELSELCDELGLACLYRATREPDTREGLPYAVRVVAMDHPGIVAGIAGFFSARQINIEDLTTEIHRAAHTGTPIFNLSMRIRVPGGENPRALRIAFEEFCEDRDLDGSMEAAP